MSKVKIAGHASGSGTLTIQAPDTSSSRTITLPDATGTLLTEVADDAITLAKMASGTDGNIISYDASGNPVAIATGSDGQVLTSTGAGSPPAFEAGGKILQVVTSVWSTDTSTTSTSYTTTGHAVTITPASTASKIWLTVANGGIPTVTGVHTKYTFYRGVTDLAPTSHFSTCLGYGWNGSAQTGKQQHSMSFIDSPSTTSATTYTVYFKVGSGTGYYTWSDSGTPVLVAMEIAG